MKHLVIVLTLLATSLNAQTYIGGEVGNKYAFTLLTEIEPDSSFVIGGFKTVVSENSELKLRAGVKIGSPNLHVVLYAPILNYSFTEKKYNTPFNGEIRYTFSKGLLKTLKVIVGVELYKDKNVPYLNLVLPFTTNKRNYKHQSF